MAKEIDFDTMSDEDFLAMDGPPEPDEENTSSEEEDNQEETVNADETDTSEENSDNGNDNPDADGDQSDDSESDSDSDNSQEEEEEDSTGNLSDEEFEKTDAFKGKPADAKKEDAPEKGKQPDADPKKEEEDSTDKKDEPVKATDSETAQAMEFYKKITMPFKADGRDFTVRSAEDVIRLMQQGVNYSRRMQEMKPMKAMSRMLSDHGLNDEKKISFLIDVSKGDKTAITKLLKDNKIDPMDLDINSETSYQAKSYAGNPEENAFRDALDETIANPDGKALVSEIHSTWDEASKRQLQLNPALLGNLTEMRRTGVYQQISDELAYQRSMGYLTNVPYLQAFDQVGEAMKNAGVFDRPKPNSSAGTMGQLSNTQQNGQPVISGARKEQAAKKPDPNPHLSSTPPAKQSKNSGKPREIDFAKMSDEEFLKIAPPT